MKPDIKNIAMYFLVSAFLTSCGSAMHDTSSLNEASNPTKNTIALIGGFGTCGDGWSISSLRQDQSLGSLTYEEGLLNTESLASSDFRGSFNSLNSIDMKRKLDDLPNTDNTEYIYVCFHSNLSSPSVKWITHYKDDVADYSGSPEEFLNAAKMIMQREPSNTAIVGHSFGGHLGMKLAEKIYQSTNVRLQSLFTIDPIDFQKCKLNLSHHCISAPSSPKSDVRNNILRQVHSNRGNWFNYYQRNSIPMSDKFTPTTNIRLNLAHTDIDTSHKVWQVIRQQFDALGFLRP